MKFRASAEDAHKPRAPSLPSLLFLPLWAFGDATLFA